MAAAIVGSPNVTPPKQQALATQHGAQRPATQAQGASATYGYPNPQAPNTGVTGPSAYGYPMSATPAGPNFQPPAPNPQIDALTQQLSQQASAPAAASPSPISLPTPPPSQTAAQTAQLQQLTNQLATGGGIQVQPVSPSDPAAQSFNIATERNAEQQRQAEADALGASGATGSGDTDARNAQIREATGTAEAGYASDLANTRQQQAIQEAETSAGLQLSDIQQQQQQAQTQFQDQTQAAESQIQQQQFGQSQAQQAAETKTSQNQALLAQLLGQQNSAFGQDVTTTQLGRQINPITGLPYAAAPPTGVPNAGYRQGAYGFQALG
jgi:hypothetical protein